LHGQAALDEHKHIYRPHKAILPIMPLERETIVFIDLEKIVCHLFVVYPDFKALLIKSLNKSPKMGVNTETIQDHCPMNNRFQMKATDSVSTELIKLFDILIQPVIFRGSEESDKVAQLLVLTIDEIENKI